MSVQSIPQKFLNIYDLPKRVFAGLLVYRIYHLGALFNSALNHTLHTEGTQYYKIGTYLNAVFGQDYIGDEKFLKMIIARHPDKGQSKRHRFGTLLISSSLHPPQPPTNLPLRNSQEWRKCLSDF